jgi:hypothetical protein
MTRSLFSRIGIVGAAAVVMAAAATMGASEAKAGEWFPFPYITTRSLACWLVGCPADGGTVKCADVTIEADAKVGNGSVTYYCYLSDKAQSTSRPEDEM